jgi:hypothetical protein
MISTSGRAINDLLAKDVGIAVLVQRQFCYAKPALQQVADAAEVEKLFQPLPTLLPNSTWRSSNSRVVIPLKGL